MKQFFYFKWKEQFGDMVISAPSYGEAVKRVAEIRESEKPGAFDTRCSIFLHKGGLLTGR